MLKSQLHKTYGSWKSPQGLKIAARLKKEKENTHIWIQSLKHKILNPAKPRNIEQNFGERHQSKIDKELAEYYHPTH